MKGKRKVLANSLDWGAWRVTGELSFPLTQLTTKLTGQAERCICVWQQGYFMLQMAERGKNCGRERKRRSTKKKPSVGKAPMVILIQPCGTSEQHPVQLCMYVYVFHLNTTTVSPARPYTCFNGKKQIEIETTPKVMVKKNRYVHTHSPSILYVTKQHVYETLLLCVNVCCAAVWCLVSVSVGLSELSLAQSWASVTSWPLRTWKGPVSLLPHHSAIQNANKQPARHRGLGEAGHWRTQQPCSASP